MELHSTRVAIRPWRYRDDVLANQWPPYDDPLDPLWNLPRQYDFDRDDWYYEFDMSASNRVWAVEDRSGRLAGRISIREINKERSSARLGITMGSPFVGRGLGTEALTTFLDYYFFHLDFRVMVLDVAAPNQRAVRCYERLGFRHVTDDWRRTGSSFNSQVLDQPKYIHLRHYFRLGRQGMGLEVRFFEMELHRDVWSTQRY